MEEKSNSLLEWGTCNEQRAAEASSHVQQAEQMIDKLAVRD